MPAPTDATALEAIARRASDAYWKSKDLNLAVELLLDGIWQGESAAKGSVDAPRFLASVKAMAFNLASFTWPGWDEEGITITPAQLAIGSDAAALNLRLAIELNRPGDKIAVAHWLVGAHALSGKEFDRAIAEFLLARAGAADDANRFLSDGYAAIANLAAGRDAAAAFDRAIVDLCALQSQDGTFFVEQLQTARKVFAAK